MEQIVFMLDVLNKYMVMLEAAYGTQAVSILMILTLAKVKVEKPPSYNGLSDKLSNQLFLVYWYLTIFGIMNSNIKKNLQYHCSNGKP